MRQKNEDKAEVKMNELSTIDIAFSKVFITRYARLPIKGLHGWCQDLVYLETLEHPILESSLTVLYASMIVIMVDQQLIRRQDAHRI